MDFIGGKIYIPAAFVMSLEADPAALHAFSRMPPMQQKAVLASARRLKSQDEWMNLLQDIIQQNTPL